MKERPILFSAPMIRALLAGAKTQTRRIVKPQPTGTSDGMLRHPKLPGHFAEHVLGHCMAKMVPSPYGGAGDRLWVRETHARFVVGEGLDRAVPECVAYRATCDDDGCFDYVNGRGEVMNLKITKWTPGIHMPRYASRITLAITKIRVERLHAITDADSWAEGIEAVDGVLDNSAICRAAKLMACSLEDARASYGALWAKINGEQSLIDNPWVWVVEFERVPEAA